MIGLPPSRDGTCQPIIPLIAIQLQDAVKARQEGLCILALAVGRVEEHDPGRIIAAPGPIIAGQRPEITGFCLAAARVQDRRRGLVHEQLRRPLQVFGQPVNNRPKVEGGHADPVGQGAAMDIDAGPGEDLALSI